MKNLPPTWSWVKLGDVTEFVYGKGLIKSKRNTDGTFPVYGSNGIVGFHNEYLVEGPCLVIGRKGAAGEVHLSNKNCWPIDTTYYVKSSEKYSINYLYYIFKNLRLASLDKSTAIPGLNRNDAYKLSIPLPPLPEQKKIVEKIEELFSQLDSGVASLKKAREQLRMYRQSVLAFAFSGKLVREVGNKLKAVSKTEMLKAAEPKVDYSNQLPVGWKWVKTSELIEHIDNGYTPKAGLMSAGSGEIPFIKVYNLKFDGKLDFTKNPIFISNTTHSKSLKRSITFPNDVLINIVGPPLGKVSIVPDTHKEWNINQAIVRFRPNKNILSKFLSYYLQNPIMIRWLESTSRATAGQYNIKVSTCREIPIPFVPVKEQTQIVSEIEKRFSEADNLEQAIDDSLEKSEALRQSILKQAFEGKLV